MEPFSIAALSGAGAIALFELVKSTCQLARRSRVTDLSFLWGLISIKRDPLQGEEILQDADAEDDYDPPSLRN